MTLIKVGAHQTSNKRTSNGHQTDINNNDNNDNNENKGGSPTDFLKDTPDPDGERSDRDKMKRIGSFVENGELVVKDESVIDTLQDLANYSCLMAGYILSEKRKQAKSGIEP